MDATRTNGAAGPDRPVPRATFVVRGRTEPRWRAALADVTLRPEPARETRALLLDSFDRRLQRAGIALTARGDAPHVRCRVAEEGGVGEVELAHCPAFAWDFPRPLGLALARTLEARCLETVGEHAASIGRTAVLDEERKVVAWIEEEEHRVRASPADEWSPPARRVVLRGVRGYGGEFERLGRVLERVAGLEPGEDGEFDPRSLLAPPPARTGRWPTLTPRIRAFAALARIGRAQLEVLEANEAGVRAGRDAEHLHDLRVAVRRLRSILGQLEGVLAEKERERLVRELRWLAARTGPARDLDTLLLQLRLCEPELRAELEPVCAHLERARAQRQAQLVRVLDSARWQKLRALLGVTFAADGSAAGPHGSKRFARVVEKRLRRRLAQAVLGAERLGSASPSAELHELRITCKKLRYLLECCRGLVRAPLLARCTADLKGMQEVLGAIQDTSVQVVLVNGLAPALAPGAGPREWLPLGRFQERLLQRGEAARTRFAEVAADFLAPASRADFADLLRELGGERKRAR